MGYLTTPSISSSCVEVGQNTSIEGNRKGTLNLGYELFENHADVDSLHLHICLFITGGQQRIECQQITSCKIYCHMIERRQTYFGQIIRFTDYTLQITITNKLSGLSLRANYTDQPSDCRDS
jgi:hypothetical protein